jgi:hypothetical protein
MALGALILLGGLLASIVFAISRQASQPEAASVAPTAAPGAPSSSPAPVVASPPVPAAGPSPTTAVAASPPPVATAGRAASPAPVGTRAPAPIAGPSPRASPAVVPTLPALVTPPGLRFPTSTPARLATPDRTPPPAPTRRSASFSARVWSEQVIHRVGEEASICGQASSGSSAEVSVNRPDRATMVLGVFQPPAERICYALRVDDPGLYVLTLAVKDAGGREIERQSSALWVSR